MGWECVTHDRLKTQAYFRNNETGVLKKSSWRAWTVNIWLRIRASSGHMHVNMVMMFRDSQYVRNLLTR